MGSKDELVMWLKKMGYDGEIPKSLENVCNASTFFIWKQIIKNAQDRRHVESIRKKIIVNRLKNESLDNQHNFQYPIPEIESYRKRQHMEKKIELMKTNIIEKEHKLNSLSSNNKMKYATIEHIKLKIRENEEKEFLLNKKYKLLQADLKNTEETLSVAKSITPVEIDECTNANEITETLQKCAEKLETFLQQMPASQKLISNKSSLEFSRQSNKSRDVSTFEKCLTRSERKLPNNSFIIKRGVSNYNGSVLFDKENVQTVKKVNKTLFTNESNLEPLRSLSPQFNEGADVEKPNTRAKNRESLGILPDFCFDLVDDDDVFLTGPIKKSILNTSIETDSVQQCLAIISENSNVLEMTSQSKLLSRLKNRNDSGFGSHLDTTVNNKNVAILENIINNKVVKDWLRELLHTQNRKLIFDNLLAKNENITQDLKKNILDMGQQNNIKISKFDIAKLHFIHVQIETQNLRFRKFNKKVSDLIIKERDRILEFMHSRQLSSGKISELLKILDMKLKDISLDVTIRCMKKEINSAQKSEYNNELQIIQKKIAGTKEKILCKLEGIQEFMGYIQKMLLNTQTIMEETGNSVRRLNQFVLDMSWAEPLSMKLVSNEVKVFESFPLNFNRKFNYMNNMANFRDLCCNILPNQNEIDSDTFYMIANILESPFSPPEAILLSILKSKLKLEQLKSTNIDINIRDYVKYSSEELQKQESYVDHALSKINHLLNSTTSNKVLTTGNRMKKIIDIWTEMPMKDFIAPNRLVNNQPYKYYEQLYDNYCNE